MRTRQDRSVRAFEALENRRLLSFAPFGAEATLSHGKAYPQANVAAAADGSYAVAYIDDAGVKLSRFAATGEAIGQPVTVLSGPHEFGLASDRAGNVIVAYTKASASPSSEFDNEMWYVRVSRSGVIGAPQPVDLATAEHLTPIVSTDRNGGFVIAWREPSGFAYRPMVRAFDASGAARAAAFELDPGRGATQRESLSELTIAAVPDGSGLHYAYVEDAQDEYHQYLRYGSASINADANDGRGMSFFGEPHFAVHDDGSFAMAFAPIEWFGNSEPLGPTATYVQRFRSDGTPIGKAAQIGTSLADEGLGIDPIDMAATPDGGYVLTYVQNVDGTDRTTLYAQRFDRAGQSDDAGPVEYFSENTASNAVGSVPPYAGPGDLSVDAAGNAVVTYTVVEALTSSYRGYATHVSRLTPAVAALDNGTLWVLGTRRSDAMSAKQRGGSVFANLGNNSLKFVASRVKRIDLEGSNGNDRIFNETSISSTIRGGSGNDIIEGGSGNDLMRGNAGDDDLSGNDGNDELIGDSGNDVLVGNNGNDRLDGGSGRDRIYGFAGNDAIFANDGEFDQLFGNAGRDSFDRDSKDSVVD